MRRLQNGVGQRRFGVGLGWLGLEWAGLNRDELGWAGQRGLAKVCIMMC